MKGFIVGLAPGSREYTVNGVKYVVGAKFRHRQSKDNFADRIKKFITSDFAHLSIGTQDDTESSLRQIIGKPKGTD